MTRRALQDQTDQALGDVQGQLSQSETELTKAIDRNRNMEQQQIDLTNQVKDLKQEINTLHTSMAQIDHEKDQLLVRFLIDYIFFSYRHFVQFFNFIQYLILNLKEVKEIDRIL